MQLKIDEFTLSFLHKQDKLDTQEILEARSKTPFIKSVK